MKGGRSSASIFLTALPAEKRDEFRDVAALEASLDAAWLRAREAYSSLALTKDVFLAELGVRVGSGSVDLEGVFAADLYLALACQAGEKEALDLFERKSLSKVHGIMSKSVARHAADETIQRLRVALFVGNERRRAKISTYSGKVPLEGWLSIVAQRELAGFLRESASPVRRVASHSVRQELANVAAGEIPADQNFFNKVGDAAIRKALAGTFRRLSAEEQKLLTWLVKEGVSIDVIGERLAVHRSTAARMVARVKARMMEGVREGLRLDLKVSESSLDSICASMAGRLDVTLSGIIGSSKD